MGIVYRFRLSGETSSTQEADMMYNVYANLRDGRGMNRVNCKPMTQEKAEAEAQRLRLGKTQAGKVFVLKAADLELKGVNGGQTQD